MMRLVMLTSITSSVNAVETTEQNILLKIIEGPIQSIITLMQFV